MTDRILQHVFEEQLAANGGTHAIPPAERCRPGTARAGQTDDVCVLDGADLELLRDELRDAQQVSVAIDNGRVRVNGSYGPVWTRPLGRPVPQVAHSPLSWPDA